MEKIVHICQIEIGNRTAEVFARIEFKDGRLSICGVEGPKRNGDAIGSCGQIGETLRGQRMELAAGWTAETLTRFLDIWKEWHLNDMQAGSPAQMANLKLCGRYQGYDWARDLLTAAGVNPDPNYLHNGKPYRYGSAWLRKEVPAEVIAFLQELPNTDITPAWV